MTIKEVTDRVQKICNETCNVQQHIDEDRLYLDVLQSIASGTCENPVECARLAITISRLDFARWVE